MALVSALPSLYQLQLCQRFSSHVNNSLPNRPQHSDNRQHATNTDESGNDASKASATATKQFICPMATLRLNHYTIARAIDY